MTTAWPKLRGQLALEGINVHAWTAADHVSVAYRLLRQRLRAEGDLNGLRELFQLTNDHAALAALARENMGQTARIETTR